MKTKEQRKEKILDSLFLHCKLITNTADDVLHKLLSDLKVHPPSEIKEKALDVVKTYKRTRTGLENTVEELHNLLYPPSVTSSAEKDVDPDNWETF